MTRDGHAPRDQRPHPIGSREAPRTDAGADAENTAAATTAGQDGADEDSRTRALKPTHIPSRSPEDDLD
jgi:hypothetical protein